jgi:hypothetical protein
MSVGPIKIANKLVLVNGFIPDQLITGPIVLQLIGIDCPPNAFLPMPACNPYPLTHTLIYRGCRAIGGIRIFR